MSKYCLLFLLIYSTVSISVNDWAMNRAFTNFPKMLDHLKAGCEGKVMIWTMVPGPPLWSMDHGPGLWAPIFTPPEAKPRGVNYSLPRVHV